MGTVQTQTLAEFLLERFAEDEERARTRMKRAQETQLMLQDPWFLGRRVPGWHDWPDVEADAARRIADCEAKRRIVVRCQEMQTAAVPMAVHLATQTLADLGRPYADRPDYREGWRPPTTRQET